MKQGYTHVSFVLDNSGSMRHLRGDTVGGYNSFLAKQKEDPGKMTFSLYQFNPEAKYRGYYAGARQPMVAPVMPLTGVANTTVFVGVGTVIAPAQAPGVGVGVISIGGGSEQAPFGGLGYDPKASAISIASPGILMNGISENPLLVRPDTVSSTYEFVDLKFVPELSMDTYKCDTNTPLLDAIGHAIDQTGKLLAALSEEERPEKVIFVILTDGEENASIAYNHLQVISKIKEQTEVYNWDFMFLGADQDAIQAGQSFGITRGRSMSLSSTAASMGSSYNAVSETISLMKCALNTKDVNFDETIRSAVLDGTYAGKK